MVWDKAVEDWAGEFDERARRMLPLYCKTLSDLGYDPVPYPDMDALMGDNIYVGGKYDALCHAHWMCDEAARFIREGRRAKAYRWIGMIQGILWMGAVYSITDLRSHNELPQKYWRERDR